jgi:hypothetical protein
MSHPVGSSSSSNLGGSKLMGKWGKDRKELEDIIFLMLYSSSQRNRR